MSNGARIKKVQRKQLSNELIHKRIEINYLLRELYKAKPDHEVFIKNPTLAKKVQDGIEQEKRIEPKKE
jgi:hypothetical protein